jgi:hypothetical protein
MTKICLIAGNSQEALNFAKLQNIPREAWFYPKDERDLLFRSNFYVLVIGTAGMNIPSSVFEKIYQLALERGKIGRF